MAMEGLGRLFNVVPIAAGKKISMKDCQGITFVCTGDDTFTLHNMSAYNGTGATLATITGYYTNTATDGSAEWVAATQSAADSVAIASGSVSFYVDSGDLASGDDWVEVTVGSGGLVTAILHDLLVQRAPANLRVVSGSSS
jgi:hypothetical protein